MSKKVLMIIAPINFRDEELFHTKEELEIAGNKVTVASTTKAGVRGMLGAIVHPDLLLEQVNVDDYDAIIFVGGTGSWVYFDDRRAHEIAKSTLKKGKLIGAICVAPSILANAGLLKGKKATCYSSEEDNLIEKGAEYTGKPVEIDGKIITADGPMSAREFGKKIAKSL